MREGAETTAKDVKRLQERVTQLSSSVNYVLPTGKLKMRHQPSRSEVLWTPADPLPDHPKPSVEALNTMWGAVVNQVKQQQLELQEAWAFVEESLNSPKMDAYSALHGCVRAAVEAVSGVLIHHVGDHVSGVRPGKTLTEDLMDLPRRSRCSLEVVDLQVEADRQIAELKSQLANMKIELAASQELVKQKTKDVSTMHAYGTRHAECLQRLTQAMQPIADTLQQTARVSSTEDRVLSDTRDLELGDFRNALTEVERRSQPIGMHRRTGADTAQATTASTSSSATLTAAEIIADLRRRREGAAQAREARSDAEISDVSPEEERRLLASPTARQGLARGTSGSPSSRQRSGSGQEVHSLPPGGETAE